MKSLAISWIQTSNKICYHIVSITVMFAGLSQKEFGRRGCGIWSTESWIGNNDIIQKISLWFQINKQGLILDLLNPILTTYITIYSSFFLIVLAIHDLLACKQAQFHPPQVSHISQVASYISPPQLRHWDSCFDIQLNQDKKSEATPQWTIQPWLVEWFLLV